MTKKKTVTPEEAEAEINACQIMLRDSDYKAHKFAEGLISEEDYAETKAQRQAWRDKINEMQEILAEADDPTE